MILIIDNYDSFTFNLVQYFGEIYDGPIEVFRNDRISVDGISEKRPRAIIISPGPCTPREAGISVDVILKLGSKIPILGVCLGHQSIGHAFGGNVVRAPYLMHGKASEILHDGRGIYENIPNRFKAARYHSLVIDDESCPKCLEVTARTEDGIIMGVRHNDYPVFGVQYHPESILTEHGRAHLHNFLNLAGVKQTEV